MTTYCGTGGANIPLPGDPDNAYSMNAIAILGGIRVGWGTPSVNRYAVSFYEIRRNTTDDIESSTQVGATGGTYYDDYVTSGVTYYYWVRWISIHGTEGAWIGPSFASARPFDSAVMDSLTDKLSTSHLGQSLRSSIERIDTNALGITQEMMDRAAEDEALAVAVDTMSARLGDAEAAIQEESLARIDELQMLAAAVSTVAVKADSKTQIYYQPDEPAEVVDEGSYWIDTDDGDVMYRWDGTEWVAVDIITADQTMAAIQENNRSMIGYCEIGGTASMHGTPGECELAGGTWHAAQPFSESVKTAQVSDKDGNLASVQQLMQAYGTELEGLGAMYTAKVESNGLVGGFGIYNDGNVVDAIFNVDTFGVGKLEGDGSTTVQMPFLISGNNIYFNGLVDFSKVENGPPADATRNVHRGDWQSGAYYSSGDIVYFPPNTWVCALNHTSSTSLKPPSTKDGTSTYWKLFGPAGDDGEPGQPGADGKDGQVGSHGRSVDMIFRRSLNQPATPNSSDGTPHFWYTNIADVPVSSDRLWSCVGTRESPLHQWQWETPVQLEGQDGAQGPQGVPGTDGQSVVELVVYKRTDEKPSTPTGTWSFSSQAFTALSSGWSISIPEGPAKTVYASVGVAYKTGVGGSANVSFAAPTISYRDGENAENGLLDPYFDKSVDPNSSVSSSLEVSGNGKYWSTDFSYVTLKKLKQGAGATDLGTKLILTANSGTARYLYSFDGYGTAHNIRCTEDVPLSFNISYELDSVYGSSSDSRYFDVYCLFYSNDGTLAGSESDQVDIDALRADGQPTPIGVRETITLTVTPPKGATQVNVRLRARYCAVSFYSIHMSTNPNQGLLDNWIRPRSTQINGNTFVTADAFVDTLHIKGNAVTVPKHGTGATLTGNGSWETNVVSIPIQMNEYGDIIIFWSVGQGYLSYSSGDIPKWGIKIKVNGSSIFTRTNMAAPNDYPSGTARTQISGGNTHIISADWYGETSAITGRVQLVVIGVQR